MSDSEAQNSPEESASDAPPLPSGIPLPGPLSSLGEELRTDVARGY
jgi:hypothetical protein